MATQYIKGKDGKMAGSIGGGKTTIPTAGPSGTTTVLEVQNEPNGVGASYEKFQQLTALKAQEPLFYLRDRGSDFVATFTVTDPRDGTEYEAIGYVPNEGDDECRPGYGISYMGVGGGKREMSYEFDADDSGAPVDVLVFVDLEEEFTDPREDPRVGRVTGPSTDLDGCSREYPVEPPAFIKAHMTELIARGKARNEQDARYRSKRTAWEGKGRPIILPEKSVEHRNPSTDWDGWDDEQADWN